MQFYYKLHYFQRHILCFNVSELKNSASNFFLLSTKFKTVKKKLWNLKAEILKLKMIKFRLELQKVSVIFFLNLSKHRY